MCHVYMFALIWFKFFISKSIFSLPPSAFMFFPWHVRNSTSHLPCIFFHLTMTLARPVEPMSIQQTVAPLLSIIGCRRKTAGTWKYLLRPSRYDGRLHWLASPKCCVAPTTSHFPNSCHDHGTQNTQIEDFVPVHPFSAPSLAAVWSTTLSWFGFGIVESSHFQVLFSLLLDLG